MFRIIALSVTLLLGSMSARAELDTAAWDQLLGSAVSDGRVDYAQWRDDPRFDELVEQVGATDTSTMDRSQKVAGERISLHQLEHEWIRPLKEPRIHFAIVCASQSCPILQSEAYTAERLDEQLEAAARGFINDRSRNQFDAAAGQAELSMIFKWFEEDFEEESGSVQAYLAPLVENAEASSLLSRDGFRIRHLEYDWSLNGSL